MRNKNAERSVYLSGEGLFPLLCLTILTTAFAADCLASFLGGSDRQSLSHPAILADMGKRQRKRQHRLFSTLGGREYQSTHAPTRFAVVKVTAPALRLPAYQRVPYGDITLDELRQEILAHLSAHHTDSQYWHVDLWDADHVPPGAVPDNVTFSSQASSEGFPKQESEENASG